MSDWKTAWGKFRQQQDKTEPQKQTVAGSQASKTVAQQCCAVGTSTCRTFIKRWTDSVESRREDQLPPEYPFICADSLASTNRTTKRPPTVSNDSAAPQQDQVTKHSRGRIDASIASSPTVRTERRPPSLS